MTKPAPEAPLRLVLAADEGTGSITVELESFVQFNLWMNDELAKLEKQFASFATPGWKMRRRNVRRP